MSFCQICLRIDRKLKVVDYRLSEFHDEMCDFSLDAIDPRYCMECEHMLRRFHKFKIKCIMSIKLIKQRKKTKAADKTPLSLLYTLLPPSSLGVCNQTYYYEMTEQGNLTRNMKSSSQPYIVIVPIENIVEDQTLMEDTVNQESVERTISNSDIKLEKEYEDFDVLQDIVSLKDEGTSHFEEIMLQNDLGIIEPDVSNEKPNKDGKTETNPGDSVMAVQDSDMAIEDSIMAVLDSDMAIDDSNMAIEDSDMAIDNSVAVLDDDDQKMTITDGNRKKTKRRRVTHKRRSLAELAGITLEDRDYVINVDIEKKNSKTKCGGKKKLRKEELNDLRKRKKLESDGDGAESGNGDVEVKKERFHTKRNLIGNIREDLDAIFDSCDGIRVWKGKIPYSKGRLKADLKAKFDACGELKVDGTIIEKQFILTTLDDKLTDYVMRKLWRAIQGKRSFTPRALKILKCIQNKYKNVYESVFDIEFLNTKRKMLDEFDRRKTYNSYLTAEYKCDICYQGFKHEKRLDYHKKCHDESAGEFVCYICSSRYKTKRNLKSHINSHEAVYKCKLCPLVTYYKGSMVNHYQQHKGVKFKCESCNCVYGSVSAYRTHISYRHKRPHVCTLCARAFYTEIGLKWHRTREHKGEETAVDVATGVRCELCELTFPTQDVLTAHVRTSHERAPIGRPPGTYELKGPRKSPMRPRKQPVFTCRVCNAVGHSCGWLTLHFSTEHPSTDKSLAFGDKLTTLCHICGKGFTTIYNLRDHLLTHSGSRPHACGACPARFHRALALRQHRLLHAPPAKRCAHCGKYFRSQSNLTNHIRFHIGERRYKCKICDKGFLHRCTLNEHVRGVHHQVRRVRKRATDKGQHAPASE